MEVSLLLKDIYSNQSLYLVTRGAKKYNDNSLLEYYALTRLKSHYAIRNEFLISAWNTDITYGITAVKDDGEESPPASYTLNF